VEDEIQDDQEPDENELKKDHEVFLHDYKMFREYKGD